MIKSQEGRACPDMAQRAGVRVASASFHYWGFSAPAKTFTASSYTLSITLQPLKLNYIQTTKHKGVSQFIHYIEMTLRPVFKKNNKNDKEGTLVSLIYLFIYYCLLSMTVRIYLRTILKMKQLH